MMLTTAFPENIQPKKNKKPALISPPPPIPIRPSPSTSSITPSPTPKTTTVKKKTASVTVTMKTPHTKQRQTTFYGALMFASLIIGAVAAKRLRKNGALSECLEHESYDDLEGESPHNLNEQNYGTDDNLAAAYGTLTNRRIDEFRV